MFDFSALCKRAIHICPGATRIVNCEKREGGFNRVFLLTMDNGPCIIARVPKGIAGPPRLTTNSEVATMTYCKAKPCPLTILGGMTDSLTNLCLHSTIQDLTSDTKDPRLE